MHRATLESVLACPADGSDLTASDAGYRCTACGHEYVRGAHGYLELFVAGDPAAELLTTAAHPASGRERGEARLYESYLREWLGTVGAQRVLDAGCGPGFGVVAMLHEGLDAYGIDLPEAANEWRDLGHDPDRYVCGNVTRLPFRDDAFDAVITIGVIEHIGTTSGQVTLGPDFEAQRALFARELLRVTRPNGRILLSGPNRRFPIDVQHGPRDLDTRAPVRSWFFLRTGLNVHRVFGRYHLASYSDVGRWFAGHDWRALPLEGFFAFSSFQRPDAVVAKAARGYVHGLPRALRRTPLNPYVLVEVTA